jgi:methylated-DNA-[protein]-cysteine S-methyltransferase
MNLPRYREIMMQTGAFLLIEEPDGEIRTGWAAFDTTLPRKAMRAPGLLPELAGRLERFFKGDAIDFSDVPLPEGSPFHRACWAAARKIPRGSSITYAQLAAAAGSAKATRAAGQAMRRNPQPILTPCHRVVASNGRLGGFAGDTREDEQGIRTKRLLLQLEAPSGSTAMIPIS